MNVSELQSLAARRGWQAGPLTFTRIQKMGADESEFHSKLNKEEFERALAEPKTKAVSRRRRKIPRCNAFGITRRPRTR
jgi:hypothetical protein